MRKYKLTPKHKARLPEWRDRWIANAMRTRGQTDEERELARDHVEGLYRAAGLPPPPRSRIVFVPSPIVGAFAAGFSAWIWETRRNAATEDAAKWAASMAGAVKNAIAATIVATWDAIHVATWDATRDATRVAIENATRAATEGATWSATWSATRVATEDATRVAIENATRDATWAATEDATWSATEDATENAAWSAMRAATEDATWSATRVATEDATWDATGVATWAATENATSAATSAATACAGNKWLSDLNMAQLALDLFGSESQSALACAGLAYRFVNGGSHWSGRSAYISFFRHVAKLNIDYSNWNHYERLAELAGPRWVHKEFCILSDFPEVLTVDEHNRPHNDNGPFCKWRDGFSLYSIHGVRVPEWLLTRPDRLTVDAINDETNEEVRRVMIERYGVSRYVQDAQFLTVHEDVDLSGQERRLLRRGDTLVVEVVNSTVDGDGTRRRYHISVHPELRPLLSSGELGEPQSMSCHNAVASTFGLRGEEYQIESES
jgi:hypothetical protein